MSAEATELLAAWMAWDRRPSDPTNAVRRVEAISAYAVALDLSPIAVRQAMTAGRHGGLNFSTVLERIPAFLAPEVAS